MRSVWTSFDGCFSGWLTCFWEGNVMIVDFMGTIIVREIIRILRLAGLWFITVNESDATYNDEEIKYSTIPSKPPLLCQ